MAEVPFAGVPAFRWSPTCLPTPGADESLYALAFQLEEARPWAGRRAPTSAKYL